MCFSIMQCVGGGDGITLGGDAEGGYRIPLKKGYPGVFHWEM